MNVLPNEPQRVDPERFEEPEMRAALAVRDITTVYRLLQKIGFSQQRIAALTGQSQPEVSSIIHGRKVLAYDVLSRICDGLGAPRGYMGLAYDAAAPGRTDSSGIDPRSAGGEESAGNGKGAVVHLPRPGRVE